MAWKNRSDFQKLAIERLTDARVLLDAGQYSGAYYLSGYVVECALKACISKRTREFDFPDPNDVKKVFVHDLQILLANSDLEKTEWASETAKDPKFAVYWAVVKDWSERSRYEIHTEEQARGLFQAVSDDEHGVLLWLKRHW